jgi:hypothetical protein
MRCWRDRRVWDSPLSTRAKTALSKAGCIRAGDVARFSPLEIGLLADVGHRTAIEICFWLIAIFIDDEFGRGVRA